MLTSAQRREVASAAAAALAETASKLALLPVTVGFDGFIDSIIHVVDQRRSMEDADFTAIGTIADLAARIGAAAGKSANLELVITEERFGGNGPLLAGGLAQFGLPVKYIGAVGADGDPSRPHPVFAPFTERVLNNGGSVIPLAPPARTDALEFADGKLMLGKPANLHGITWPALMSTFGREALISHLGSCKLLGLVNWVMMRGAQGIWEGLIADVLSQLPRSGARPRLFFDLCDPAKRTDGDVKLALETISRIAALVPVTLGLNLSEAQRIDDVLGLAMLNSFIGVDDASNASLAAAAAAIASKLSLDSVVIHPRHGAAAACRDASGALQSGWFTGPMVRHPRLSTGAGDHFNAGFCLAQLLGLPVHQALAIATCTSGAYVRDAQSPTIVRLCELLADLPDPE